MGRREPNVGPGPAQICRISGSVKPKIYGKNVAKRCDLKKKKKGFSPKFKRFFRPNSGDLQKKKASPKSKRFFRPNLGDLQKKGLH